MLYQYEIPNYVYTVNCIDENIELLRMYFIDKIRKHIFSQIATSITINNPLKVKKKISQYLSQLLMNILTDRTSHYNDTIILEDGLLLIPNDKNIKDFYNDINYYLKSNFLPDQFNLISLIKSSIEKIQLINCDLTLIDTYMSKINIYRTKIPEIPPLILQKCKKFYKNNLDPNNLLLPKIIKCCQIRYEALMSGSNQFMVDLSYKKKLKKLGFNFECFGSMFNRYFDNFCSMFYDLEKYFGSCGSFFALKIISGNYMANPPYDDNLLTNMYLKIKKLILNNFNVCFIMSIPKWDNYHLENTIDNDKLYIAKRIKHEKFHDPDTLKLVPIPPYISYIFSNNKKDIDKIKDVFINFENYQKIEKK